MKNKKTAKKSGAKKAAHTSAVKKAALVRRTHRIHLAWMTLLGIIIVATGYHVFADRNSDMRLATPAGTIAREAELNRLETHDQQQTRANYDASLVENAALDSEALHQFTGARDE